MSRVRRITACLVAAAMTAMLVPAVPAAAASYSFSYKVNDDGTAMVTGISNLEATNIAIPSTIDGYEVAGLFHTALNGSKVETLSLPDTLRYIGSYYAGEHSSVDSSGIVGTYALSSITVDSDNPYFTVVDGVLYSADMRRLICYPSEKKGTSFSVPEGVRDLTTNSFQAAYRYLETITLPASLERLWSNPLGNCAKLSSIKLSSANLSFSVVDDVLYSHDLSTLVTYPNGKTDKSFTVPFETTSIGIGSISGQRYLEKVVLHADVSKMESSLVNCEHLKKIVVDPGNTSFAVSGGVLFSRDMTSIYAYPSGLKKNKYTLPNTVTTIENGAFVGCDIASIILPASVTTLMNGSCFWSQNLGTIYVSSEEQYSLITASGYDQICPYDASTGMGTKVAYVWDMTGEVDGGEGAAPVLKQQFAVEVPTGKALFTLTAKYKSAKTQLNTMATKATYAGEVRVDFFPVGKGGVVSLNTLRYNNQLYKITAINKGVLKKSKNAAAVTLGDNVVTVASGAFQGCPNLRELRLGKGLKSIGKSAFYKCPKLASIVVAGTGLKAGKVGSAAFKGTAKKAAFKVPKSKLKAYKKLFVKAGASKKATFRKA